MGIDILPETLRSWAFGKLQWADTFRSLAYLKRTLWRSFDKPHIDYLAFMTTYRCNATCPMCLIWAHPRGLHGDWSGEMTLREYRAIAEDPICRYVTRTDFTGGEPFLREDLADIVRIFTGRLSVQDITIPTNGTYTQRVERFVDEVREFYSGRLTIGISLDGTEEVHDQIRGRGIYRKATKTFSMLRERMDGDSKLGTGIYATIIGTQNVDSVAELVEEYHPWVKFRLAIECENNENVGKPSLTETPWPEVAYKLRPDLGEWSESDSHKPEVVHKYWALMDRYSDAYGPLKTRLLPMLKQDARQPNLPCHVALDKVLYFKPFGEVYACVYSWPQFYIGNVREEKPLGQMVLERAETIRKFRAKCSGCVADCYYMDNMTLNGGR